MPLIRTKYHKLPTYAQGDYPGAGEQPDPDNKLDSWYQSNFRPGVNHIIQYLDEILQYLNPDGTWKEDGLDLVGIGESVDGSTIIFDPDENEIRVGEINSGNISARSIKSNLLKRGSSLKKYYVSGACPNDTESAGFFKFHDIGGGATEFGYIIPVDCILTSYRLRVEVPNTGFIRSPDGSDDPEYQFNNGVQYDAGDIFSVRFNITSTTTNFYIRKNGSDIGLTWTDFTGFPYLTKAFLMAEFELNDVGAGS